MQNPAARSGVRVRSGEEFTGRNSSPPSWYVWYDRASHGLRQSSMTVRRNQVDRTRFNDEAVLPFQLRLDDFALAIQDVYDFFYDVNMRLVERGLERLDDMLRP